MEEQKQVHPHIVPTVGRVVWYWPNTYEPGGRVVGDVNQPMRADICFVHNDGTVTLSVNDHAGCPFSSVGVTLHQGDAEGCSLPRPFATWMPFQRGQASKNDQLKADLLELQRTAIEAAHEALEDETHRLKIDMLREQVRELRLKNDFSETQVAIKGQELAREKAATENYQAQTELLKQQVAAGTWKP